MPDNTVHSNLKNTHDNNDPSQNGIFTGLKPKCSFNSSISNHQIDKLKRYHTISAKNNSIFYNSHLSNNINI